MVEDINKLGKFEEDTLGKLQVHVKRIISFINQFSVWSNWSSSGVMGMSEWLNWIWWGWVFLQSAEQVRTEGKQLCLCWLSKWNQRVPLWYVPGSSALLFSWAGIYRRKTRCTRAVWKTLTGGHDSFKIVLQMPFKKGHRWCPRSSGRHGSRTFCA